MTPIKHIESQNYVEIILREMSQIMILINRIREFIVLIHKL